MGPLIGTLQISGPPYEHMILDIWKRRQRRLVGIAPSVVEIERCSVVYEPCLVVPHQHIRIAGRAVDIGEKCVEPHYVRRFAGPDRVGIGIISHGAPQEVEAEVEATAPPQKILDLLVGLGAPEIVAQIEHHQLRHPQTESAGHLAPYQLGNERLGAMACATVLHYISEAVVGFHQARERSPSRRGAIYRRASCVRSSIVALCYLH